MQTSSSGTSTTTNLKATRASPIKISHQEAMADLKANRQNSSPLEAETNPARNLSEASRKNPTAAETSTARNHTAAKAKENPTVTVKSRAKNHSERTRASLTAATRGRNPWAIASLARRTATMKASLVPMNRKRGSRELAAWQTLLPRGIVAHSPVGHL